MRIGPPVTPDVIKGLLIANVAVYLLQTYAGITDDLVVRPVQVWESGAIWQTFTYMWAHGGLWHLGGNMLMLWMFGSEVAAHWGTKRFLSFYLASGIGAGFIIAFIPALLHAMDPSSASYFIATLGASGAVYAVLLAHSLMFPDRTIMLIFPPIPLKALYLIPFMFFMEILSPRAGVSHVGHLGGVFVGWALLWRLGITRVINLDQLKLRYRRYKMRRNLKVVQEEDLKDRRERNDAARQRRREERDRDGGWMH